MENMMKFRKYATLAGLGTQEILLWMHLYMTMERLGQWIDVAYATDDLMRELQITRRSFYRTRQMLMNKQLLTARRTKTAILYTLHLQWEELQEPKACPDEELVVANELPPSDQDPKANELFDKQPSIEELPKPDYLEPEDTVIAKDVKVLNLTQDQSYMEPLRLFCKGRSTLLHLSLLQWASMREKYHWDLTAEELKIMLGSLNRLGQEKVRKERAARGEGLSRYAKEDVDNAMLAIVEQSLKWRWKSFWPVDDYQWEKPDGNGPVVLQEMTMGFETEQNQGAYTKPIVPKQTGNGWHNEPMKKAT